jgi:hypothetical protein
LLPLSYFLAGSLLPDARFLQFSALSVEDLRVPPGFPTPDLVQPRERRGKKREVDLDMRHAVWAVEQEANRLLTRRHPQTDSACKLLLKAIESARPQPAVLRLYDRLSATTVKYDLPRESARILSIASRPQPAKKGKFIEHA